MSESAPSSSQPATTSWRIKLGIVIVCSLALVLVTNSLIHRQSAPTVHPLQEQWDNSDVQFSIGANLKIHRLNDVMSSTNRVLGSALNMLNGANDALVKLVSVVGGTPSSSSSSSSSLSPPIPPIDKQSTLESLISTSYSPRTKLIGLYDDIVLDPNQYLRTHSASSLLSLINSE